MRKFSDVQPNSIKGRHRYCAQKGCLYPGKVECFLDSNDSLVLMSRCENHKVDDRFMYPRGRPWADDSQILGRVPFNFKKVGYVRLLYEEIAVPRWVLNIIIVVLAFLIVNSDFAIPSVSTLSLLCKWLVVCISFMQLIQESAFIMRRVAKHFDFARNRSNKNRAFRDIVAREPHVPAAM